MKSVIRGACLILGVLMHWGVSAAQNPDVNHITAALETLQTSVNARDFTLLEPRLDEKFTYQGRASGISRTIMRQVVEGYPHDIVDISILSITADDTNWSIGVRIEGPDGLEQRIVHLTNDYRILQADIADIELAGHAAAPARPSSTPQPSALPDAVSIPFS
jgi:hypothetical protein